MRKPLLLTILVLLTSISLLGCEKKEHVTNQNIPASGESTVVNSKISNVAGPEETQQQVNQTKQKETDNTYKCYEKVLNSNVEIEKLKKRGKKYYFKQSSFNSKNQKYVKIVWNWMLKGSNIDSKLSQETIRKERGLSRDSMFFIFVDLNNDKKQDFIVVPASVANCGNGSLGCIGYIFLGPDYSKPINIMSICHSLSFYILNTSTNGLKDFIVNDGFLCKFNKAQNSYDCN